MKGERKVATSQKNKVLFVAGMYPTPKYPQKGIFCHEQVKALIQLGVDVTVAVPVTVYDREIKQDEWQFDGVRIKYIRYFKIPGTLDFHRAGHALYRSLNKTFDFSSYDIIHADAALPTGQAAMIASKKYGIPYVVHGHGLDVYLDVSYRNKTNCRLIVDASKEVYENSSAVIGVSRKVINNVINGVDVRDKAFVAYNGVDTDRFYPIPHENEKLVVSVIGNLIPLKGHRYLLDAVNKYQKAFPDEMIINIIGRGPLEEELMTKSEELGLSSIVRFMGYIAYHKVAAELQYSDIFVLPSYYEALGCVYLEAMACGIPAVGCWNNGIDEIIENGKDGFLVDEKNSDQIYEDLVLLRDRAKREQIGGNARKKAERYTWLDSAKAVEEVYNRVLFDSKR